jgi:hypothetical protein
VYVERPGQSPKASISAACKGYVEVIAASRFFRNAKLRQSQILAPHREATLLRVNQHEGQQVLYIQDTTELDFTSRKKLEGSGPLSNVERRGFFAHNELVVSQGGLPLGLWHTSIWARDDQEHGKAEERKQRPIEEKESFRWLESYRRACELAEAAPKTQVVACSDRESDIYEIFGEREKLLKEGKPAAHWLIRAKHDRCLEQSESSLGSKLKISDQLKQSPVIGQIRFSIPAKEQNKKIKGGSRKKTIRSKRGVVQDIRAIEVTLEPPYRAGHKLDPVKIFVIQAVEVNPPAGEEPINWTLLTSLECRTEEQVRHVFELYLRRWQIEVFHRVLKTGCRVESLQLESAQSIKLAVLLYMIVAWRVLYVMYLGRECPDLDCSVVFETAEWHATWVILKKSHPPEKPPSLNDMVRMIASFGGFLGRKSDGHPGAESVWRGMSRVLDFSFCWQLWGSAYLQSTG